MASEMNNALSAYCALANEFGLDTFNAIGYLTIPTTYFDGDRPVDHMLDSDFIEKMQNKLGVIW